MFNSTDYRELRNGKRYQISSESTMSNHGSTEEIENRSSLENASREVPEFQTLTQETVNEQIRGFIAPLTRQLEELTRLVQGRTTSRHPNFYPRTELGTTSGTVMPQSYIHLFKFIFEIKGNETRRQRGKFIEYVILHSEEIRTCLRFSPEMLSSGFVNCKYGCQYFVKVHPIP